MQAFEVGYLGEGSRRLLRAGVTFAGVALLGLGSTAWAKEASLTAIELYDGASGAAYVQLGDVLINGKVELRNCGEAGSGPIDKSEFGKMPKLQIATGGVLERGQDGVLRYSSGGSAAFCVVPENLKFEHGASFAAAAIADMVDLRGRALAPGTDGAAAAQPLKKGVKLVFVAAPDVELAEYLLAARVGSQTGWQNYLAKYAAATHTAEAKRSLAALYIAAGEKALGAYESSRKTDSPSYANLKAARGEADRAHGLLPNSEGEVKLAGEIRTDLGALTDQGQAELDAYKAALAGKTPGYRHLQNARALVDAVSSVDPGFPPLAKLKEGVTGSAATLDSALHAAEQAEAAKKWDEAIHLVEPYRSFAGEEPRVGHVIDGVYAAYFEQGQQLDATKEWKGAIENYQHALQAKETAEAKQALEAAQKEYGAAEDDATAKAALEKSKTLELQKDMIPAYEVLTSLTDSQRALVKDDIARLEPAYVTAASLQAKQIAQAYPTIGGIGDERAVEKAYNYLDHAYNLSTADTDKQGYQLRMQNLGDELAGWFLDRAKHSLEKPLGSGTELGWSYLKEAESYQAANLEAVRDQMKMSEPAHGMHSRLSIRVQFRDQTSQRQSEGFASQMENAIAANLDTPGMQVKVIRSTDAARQELDPDFVIAGDVLEHNISMPPTVESVDSTYVAGVHEIPSEQWSKLNRQYDEANDELRTAQAALQGAEAKGNKKAVSEANKQVSEVQLRVNDLRANLDATAKSHTEDIIRSYSYKKTTYNVINRIVLQFRIDDALSGQKGEPAQVSREEHTQFVVISDVKPEDANKVKNEGTLPDREELQNELENKAREELIKEVKAKVVELPHQVYTDAQKREQDGYKDDAGEAYMRYLNVAPADQLPERTHAEKFLREEFNFQVFPGEVRESPRRLPAVEQGMVKGTEPTKQ